MPTLPANTAPSIVPVMTTPNEAKQPIQLAQELLQLAAQTRAAAERLTADTLTADLERSKLGLYREPDRKLLLDEKVRENAAGQQVTEQQVTSQYNFQYRHESTNHFAGAYAFRPSSANAMMRGRPVLESQTITTIYPGPGTDVYVGRPSTANATVRGVRVAAPMVRILG